MMKNGKYIVSFGKPDGNKELHIGHLSGVAVHADIFCRALRRNGVDATLISGTDGFGASVYQDVFLKYGHPPTREQLLNHVAFYHERQLQSLRAYDIRCDLYPNNTNKDTSKEIKKKCDFVFNRLIKSDGCKLMNDVNYFDPVLQAPVGKKQLFTDSNNVVRSIITNARIEERKTKNFFLNLEQYREIIVTALERLRDCTSSKFLINYARAILNNQLPCYRITSQQPWSLSVENWDAYGYQVWFESLLASQCYAETCLINEPSTPDPPILVQFIAEDTLFFYIAVQPVLWHFSQCHFKLPQLHCNRTRMFWDNNGNHFFCDADEMQRYYSTDAVRLNFASRGTTATNIFLTDTDMLKIWRKCIEVLAMEISEESTPNITQYRKLRENIFNDLLNRDFVNGISKLDFLVKKIIKDSNNGKINIESFKILLDCLDNVTPSLAIRYKKKMEETVIDNEEL